MEGVECQSKLFINVNVQTANRQMIIQIRSYIIVGYREVKQNHAFGRTLSTELEVVYGQLVLGFLAHTCLSITRLLTAKLHDKTLGWIKRYYFNAIVELRITAGRELTVLFPPWLFDSYGLPEYCTWIVSLLSIGDRTAHRLHPADSASLTFRH